MELRTLLGILNRRKWIILVTSLVTLAVVAVGVSRMAPVYSASAVARVAGTFSSTVNYSDLNYSQRLRETYAFLLKSRPFLRQVADRLGLEVDLESLASAINVESLPNTELIQITVENSDPQLAAAIANTLTELLVEQGQRLYSGAGKSAVDILQEQLQDLEGRLNADRALLVAMEAAIRPSQASADASMADLAARIQVQEQTYSTLLSQYEKARTEEALRANSISIAEPAVAPWSPSKPNTRLYILLGALVGLVGGLGLALLFENLDPTLHSAEDLQAAVSMSLLGRIPQFKARRRHGQRTDLLWGARRSQIVALDAFRVLCVNTLATVSGEDPRSLMIAGAEAGVGKSMVAANLAGAIAVTGRRVILVDADMRKPGQHELFAAQRNPGMSDVLLDAAVLDAALQTSSVPGLLLLAAGSPGWEHVDLFTSDKLASLSEQLKARADIVVWDTPPILAVADAAVLAPLVDGVLLVTARDHTSGRQLDLALDALANVGVRPIGAVFNRAESDSADGRYYRDYHDYHDSSLPRAEHTRLNGHSPSTPLESTRQASLPPSKRTN